MHTKNDGKVWQNMEVQRKIKSWKTVRNSDILKGGHVNYNGGILDIMEEYVIIVIDDIEFINHLPYTREEWRKPISGVKRKDALTMDDVTGNTGDELDRRAAALDLRERKLTAREKLREKGLPEYLVDALNMETDETFKKSMEAVLKMKGEAGGSPGPKPVGKMNLIGGVTTSDMEKGDALRAAFGL